MKNPQTSTARSSARSWATSLAVLGAALFPGVAFAQDPPAEAPAAAEPAAPEPAPAPEPVAEPPAEVAPTTDEPAPEAAMTEAAPAEEAAPPEEKPFEPSFTIGAGMRTGLDLNFDPGTLSLNDGLVDQINVRPFMGGNLTPMVSYWVQFEIGSAPLDAANGVTDSFLPNFAILDAIAQLKFMEELQLWVGQHIPAGDRNNMNGPFFGNGWNFAIAAGGYPFDMGARDRGFTLWGLVAGGKFKYKLSMVDLQPDREIGQSRFGARADLHLWKPEAFYYNSGTYFGGQDILTIGASVQGQSGDDMVDDDDLVGFNIDGMFEKNFGKGGTLTAEAGYFNFDNTGAAYVVNQGSADATGGVPHNGVGEGFLGVLSWLTPEKIGAGKLQPNARFQYGDYSGTTTMVIDVGLAYVIDGFNHKYHLNYRHVEAGPNGGASTGDDSLQIGFQYMMAK
jgi:hypothetical protein